MTESIAAGTLYIVSTPIGNLQDITHRAVHILQSVDCIAAEDTRTSHILLDHLGITKPLVSYYAHNEVRRIPELIDRLHRGEAVALITDAGTPGISDPAFAIVRETLRHGYRVVPVPGASALLAALVVSGLPTDRFVFEGFLPTKKGRQKRIEFLREEERTIVLYEAPHRLLRTLSEIHSVIGDRGVAVARELTKKFEEVHRGTLAEVLRVVEKKAPRGEYVIVIAGADKRKASNSRPETSNGTESRGTSQNS
jgi:16S rRNA (cytidine1402-2'-O)-methyltransferase